MTDCTNCGLSSLPGQKFCAECGTALERDSVPGAVSVSGELPTQKQSESVNPACADCETPLETGSQYCFECGKPVEKSPGVSELEAISVPTTGSVEGSANSDAAAGFLGALWGGSASCGCGCFSLVILVGLLAVLGAFL